MSILSVVESDVNSKAKPRRVFLRGIVVSTESVKLCQQLGRWKQMITAAGRRKRQQGGLSMRARAVADELAALFSQAKDDGLAWPTEAELASRMGVHRSTIIRAMNELRSGGYLMAMQLRKAGRNNVYALALPNVDTFFLGYEDEDEATAKMRHEMPRFCDIECSRNATTHKSRGNESDTESTESHSESPHPLTTLAASGEVRCGGDMEGKVITLDSRRQSPASVEPVVTAAVTPSPSTPMPTSPSAQPDEPSRLDSPPSQPDEPDSPPPPQGSAPSVVGGWPFNPRFAPKDEPFASRPDLHHLLVRFGYPGLHEAIGFDRDHDRPDGHWLPRSIRPVVKAELEAGTLTPRRLLDILWPTVASGELRAAFDAARVSKWEREGEHVRDRDPRREAWLRGRR
jgi:transcriptional regulator with XRE-family HTH domain